MRGKELTFGNIVSSIDNFITVYRSERKTSYVDLRSYTYTEPIGVVILKSIALDKKINGEELGISVLKTETPISIYEYY